MNHFLVQFTFCLFLVGLFSCNEQDQPSTMVEANPIVPQQPLGSKDILTNIAFGSCNKQNEPQPVWTAILEKNPDLWIWLGDNIYGDTENMVVMKNKYDLQLSNEGYQQLLAACPVVGIWDDHDYGANNAGKEFTEKAASQQLMLDFLGVPENAPQRSRAGAYSSYTFGPENQQVKILLLDARYFRDAPIIENGDYVPNTTGTILGTEQWAWLETELQESTAQVHLIGSGIQMIPADHRFEKWANFPTERERLFDLIKQYKPAQPILLSGDRHIGEISRIELTEDLLVYEVTSSGLTHSYESVGDEPNQYRFGPITGQKNYGLLQLDWATDPVTVKMQLRGLNNNIYSEAVIE